MLFVGINGVLAIVCTQLISFNGLKAAYEDLHQLNRALIENRVKIHIVGIEPADDNPPLAPRLH